MEEKNKFILNYSNNGTDDQEQLFLKIKDLLNKQEKNYKIIICKIENLDYKYCDELLFHCLKTKNYRTGKIVLKIKNKDINSIRIDNKNIIEYMIEDGSLNRENLKFILSLCKLELITSSIICKLIRQKNLDLLECIGEYKSSFINENIYHFLLFNKQYKEDLLSIEFIKEIVTFGKLDKDEYGNYPLLEVVETDDTEHIAKPFFEFIWNNFLYVDFNKENENGNYPLLAAICKNNNEMVDLIINYANKKKFLLELNKKDKSYGEYPLLRAIINNNIKIVNTLIKYANENKIILDINERNNFGRYPFLYVIIKNRIEMAKIIIDYSNENPNEAPLKINEKEIQSVSKINDEIIKLLYDCNKSKKN